MECFRHSFTINTTFRRMPILLDASFTLIHPVEPVGLVYTRHLRTATGLVLDPEDMQSAFRSVFTTASPPGYDNGCSGHTAEETWWRNLVSQVLSSVAPDAASTLDPEVFEDYFNSLFEHFANPSSWALYPETIDFLAAASPLGPLAVVSNFDNRLAPILDGLGIGPFFEHVFTSADARARKPDRALFDLALDRLNCSPRETFHCGDSLHADYGGASALGLRACHLRRPGHTLFDFLDFCRGSAH